MHTQVVFFPMRSGESKVIYVCTSSFIIHKISMWDTWFEFSIVFFYPIFFLASHEYSNNVLFVLSTFKEKRKKNYKIRLEGTQEDSLCCIFIWSIKMDWDSKRENHIQFIDCPLHKNQSFMHIIFKSRIN